MSTDPAAGAPNLAACPLQGIRVVDLGQIYNGPYATYLLALAGADVVKIEPPGGEPLRRRGAVGAKVGGAALPFAMLNGCKRSVMLDLKTPAGIDTLRQLAQKADVLVENFAPGVMDRLGLGSDRMQALNPQLIYASSSGFGRDGPYKSYPAMDLTIQAMSGVMHITGFADRPPVKAGPAMADFLAGIHLYGAIVTALFERERTGVARRLEVAMQDAVFASLSSSLGLHWAASASTASPSAPLPPRTGNRHGGLAEAPYNVYPALDGFIAIICVGETQWRSLARLMARPDLIGDPRTSTLAGRVDHMDLVDNAVRSWTQTLPTEQLFQTLVAAHVPCAPVRDLDAVINDANMHTRGAVEWQDHPDYGRIVVQQSPLRYDGLPRPNLTPSQRLGAGTADVLRDWLGIETNPN